MKKSRSYYYELLTKDKNYKEKAIHTLQAFVFGGTLCLIGQGIFELFALWYDYKTSFILLSMLMIFLAGVLTAIGIYDDLGQIAKCGLAIPITGFSNACISAAMEYKGEGVVLGVGSNALKLASSVLIFGASAGIIVTTIEYIFGWL